MSPDQDFQEKDRERTVRRRVFHLIFAILALILGGFLIWKLSGLVLPIIVARYWPFYSAPSKSDLRSRGCPTSFKCCVPLRRLVSSCSSPSTPRANIFPTTNRSSNSRYA